MENQWKPISINGTNASNLKSGDIVSKETVCCVGGKVDSLTLETSVFESFTVANLPYRPCG